MRSSCCLCVCMCILSVVARQRLGRHTSAITNAEAVIEELLDALFSMWSVSCQREISDLFFFELLIILSSTNV
jgi:hypothetical protein